MNSILIVEDDEACLDTYSVALEREGYTIIPAADGEAGLELARTKRPALILCDINLPKLDGWKLLELVRKDPELLDTQFVFMTGNLRSTSARSGMEHGADDFLEKPFRMDALLKCVAARLKRSALRSRIAKGVIKELRTSLRSSLPHEIFTPLGGILGLTEVLQDCASSEQFSEDCKLYLSEIRRSAHRLHRTLRNYLFALDLEAGDASAYSPPPLMAAGEFRSVVEWAAKTAAERQEREADLIVIGEIAKVENVGVSSNDLTVIVEELVDNACAYSANGTPVKVELTAPGILRINDNGRGMQTAELEKIGAFQQFDRKRYEQQGLGLGLFLVQKFARRNQLEFRLSSEAGRGTLAALTFPFL